MPATKPPHRYSSAAVAHLDELLDDALKATFPASDPVAINFALGVTRARNNNDDRVFTPRSEAQTSQAGAVNAGAG
jgi:hypothetical protein